MNEKAIETLAASVLFALVFIIGGRLHRPGDIRRRSVLSFSAGASVAYIFVHLTPELGQAREVFMRETQHLELPFSWYGVNLATMLGFVFFYGLEQYVKSFDTEPSDAGEKHRESRGFRIHVGIFCIYAWLVSYLLVNSLEQGAVPVGFYAIAMGLHFLTVSNGLRREYTALYDRIGSWLLAVCTLGGWAAGMLTELSRPVTAVLLGLVSGGVIVNTLIEELPREKESRFVPFVTGAVVYSAFVLIALG